MPPILGNVISRVEYQTIFLMVLKKEQEIYFKKQIEMLENGLELPYTDPLASASPFIDDKTKLLKSRGRIGYNMKSQRNIEFLQEHSEHYNIILPSRGSFVKSYLLEIHQKYNCASERFISIVRQERFFMTSPVRIGKSAISRCLRCVKRRALNTKLSTPVGNLPSYRIPSGTDPNHNLPWNCIMFDLKGPLSVINDVFKLKNSKKEQKKNKEENHENLSKVERIKLYIIVFTDCLTRASILDYVDRKSYASVKDAFVRFINTCGKPNLVISDSDSAFKAMSRDYKVSEIQ